MPRELPTVIISVHGGLVQDVFCSDPNTRVVLVDWDQDSHCVGHPGVIESDGKAVAVVEYPLADFNSLQGTDVERALESAHLHGQLQVPVAFNPQS